MARRRILVTETDAQALRLEEERADRDAFNEARRARLIAEDEVLNRESAQRKLKVTNNKGRSS